MIQSSLQKLIRKEDLTLAEMEATMTEVMEGKATESQIAGFLTALRMKGETITEITAAAKVMREKVEKIFLGDAYTLDTCGTGGDGGKTFNISTTVALVAAAAGITVVKHGNRSVSSKSGSADVLEALGVKVTLSPTEVQQCMEEVGIGFMFAPVFHKAMKYAMTPRKELGIRTIFNILGPLTNPAYAKSQVLGVFSPELTEVMAEVLKNLGTERAMVVHGEDGMDEITVTGKTKVTELRDGELSTYTIQPEDFGLKTAETEEIAGGEAGKNAEIIVEVLQGVKGPKRDIVVLNSAAALVVGKKASSLQEGILLAQELIDSGKAYKKLQELIRISKEVSA